MLTLDIVFIVVLVSGLIVGFRKGCLSQLATLAGLIIGLLAARMLYTSLAEHVTPLLGMNMGLARSLSFMAIWIAVPLAFTLLASLVTKALDVVHLGWINRISGAVFGLMKCLIFLCLMVAVLDAVDKDSRLLSAKTKSESMIYPSLQKLNRAVIPLVWDVVSDTLDKTRSKTENEPQEAPLPLL